MVKGEKFALAPGSPVGALSSVRLSVKEGNLTPVKFRSSESFFQRELVIFGGLFRLLLISGVEWLHR